MASIMPTFTPGNTNEKNYFDIVLHYGCETENCLGSVEVFENGTYGTCSSCLNMQMCDDISAPITPWEIEKYGGKLTTGICDYCETETEIDSFGWCKSCSE